MTALLPCPHCGSDETFTKSWSSENGGDWWLARCSKCGSQTTWHCQDESQAIAAWNRRSPTWEEIERDGVSGSSNASRAAMGPVAHLAPEAEPSEKDALFYLRLAADQLEKLAFSMPPPNDWTPRFVMLANSIRHEWALLSEKALRAATASPEGLGVSQDEPILPPTQTTEGETHE